MWPCCCRCLRSESKPCSGAVDAVSCGRDGLRRPRPDGRTRREPAQLAGTAAGPSPVAIAPLPSIRTAEPFERLRDLSDAYLARTGERPKVFLANLGPISAFTARATFAKNFFEAGGIEAVMNDGFPSLHALTAAFAASGAQIACICSSDEVYFGPAEAAVTPNETTVEEAARGIKRAGGSLVYMAGRPIMREDALRSAGIQEFIYVGCDLPAIMASIYSALNVRSSERRGRDRSHDQHPGFLERRLRRRSPGISPAQAAAEPWLTPEGIAVKGSLWP